MKNSENLGKTDSKKPKYDAKLIGVVASEKGPIKDIAAKYGVSQYFVRQSRESAREYGFRVYRDKLSDGEKHSIIDESYKGRSAKEISEALGGVSTSTIYHLRKEFSNSYNQPADNNVVSAQNLERRVVGTTGNIIRVNFRRTQRTSKAVVGNGSEVVGINEFDARNEDVSQGTGGDVPFAFISDEQLRQDYGRDPGTVRRALRKLKEQLGSEDDKNVVEQYDGRLYRNLRGQLDDAKSLKTADPKGSISLLREILKGQMPNKSNFQELRSDFQDVMALLETKSRAYEASKAAQAAAAPAPVIPPAVPVPPVKPLIVAPEVPAQPASEKADAQAAEFFKGGAPAAAAALASAAPAQPLAAPPVEPAPSPASTPAASNPRGDDAGHGEPTYELEVDPRALQEINRRYNSPDLSKVGEIYSKHIGQDGELDVKGFFGEMDNVFKNQKATCNSVEYKNAYLTREKFNAYASRLDKIPLKGGSQKKRTKALTALIAEMDSLKQEDIFGSLKREAAEHRYLVSQDTLDKRMKAWKERNSKYAAQLAGAGLGLVVLWGGVQAVQAFNNLERKVDDLYKLPAVTRQTRQVNYTFVVPGPQNEQGDKIKALESKATENDVAHKAYDAELKKLDKEDKDNLKLTKERFDLEVENRTKADLALGAQQKDYEADNKKAHGTLSERLQSIADSVNEKIKQAIASQPKPTGPIIGPPIESTPQSQPRPAPKPKAEKNFEGSTSVRAEGLSGDVSGHQLRTTTLFSNNEYRFKLDAFEKNEKQELKGEDVKRTTFYAMPEFNIVKNDYEFNFKGNHAQSNETRDGKSSTSDLVNESGLSVLTQDSSSWRQKTDNTLDSFSLDARVKNFRLFGDASSNRTETNYKGNTDVTVSELGNAFPPFVVNNNTKTSTEATTNSYKLGAGWDFGSVETDVIGRHNETKWNMNAELNGKSILDEKGSSSQESMGGCVRFNFDNKVAGRMTLLGNSGDDLENSQKFEGAAHGTFLLGDKFAFSLGGEKSDGGAKGRAALLWKTNDEKAGWEILQETNNFVNSAEEANLFPNPTTAEQKRNARIDKDMSAGASGVFLAGEGGKEGVDKGNYWRVDGAAPIPGTKGKAFVYGSFEDGDTSRFVEGGVGYKPNKWFEFGWGYWDSKDKEMDVHTTGTGPTIKLTW